MIECKEISKQVLRKQEKKEKERKLTEKDCFLIKQQKYGQGKKENFILFLEFYFSFELYSSFYFFCLVLAFQLLCVYVCVHQRC